MSAKLKHQDAPATTEASNNVIPLSKCKEASCKKKSEKLEFCDEHYSWFKFGLLTKEGKRPTDFDKKFQAFTKFRAA